MNDDIVTRLREIAENYDWEALCLIDEAADEIERLRKQIRQLEAERDQWQTMAVRNGNH